ncbi:response regulator transcription factor [Maribrevibacterium harenarium]|uniref:Response regulator transcription factor n=1 Tax=Maribrevibacterium harenarium TaxID=2589817 RepID=A0A501WSP7_9GAMM|nr:response regulator transcription factor [Maribrevibacterium harenarium]TPE52388.1 response regulator transcription factor [Maribrevibacterium harenarium]
MKILYAEDDLETATFVQGALTQAGHSVDVVGDGRHALAQASLQKYDLYVFDRMMPGLDGLAVIKALRAADDSTPAIFLTGLGSVDERVSGLKSGADDYLVKPFSMAELMARIEALARRPQIKAETTQLDLGGLQVKLLSHEVYRDGLKIDLQPKEYALLVYLMERPDRVQTRSMILEAVWNINFDPKTSVVETHISRLRAKVDKPFGTRNIQTLHGSGYVFKSM